LPNLTADEFREALEVNMTAPFLLTQAVLPPMREQQYGRIINISSSAGRMLSTLGGAHYTASKAGLLGLTRATAKEDPFRASRQCVPAAAAFGQHSTACSAAPRIGLSS
jgi:3-oxoacyl-[acyl-carrier protein] reductase